MRRKYLVPKLIFQEPQHVELEKIASPAEVTAEDKQLNDIINNMKFNLTELRNEEENHPLVQEWRTKKRDFLLKWAHALDRKIELGTWDRPKDWIASHISKELRLLQFNENEIDYVAKVLPKEFKRESLARIGGTISPDLDEIISIGNKDIEHYSPEELVKYVDNANQVIKLAKDRNKTLFQNLELTKQKAKETAEQYGVYINLEEQEDKDVISTLKPEAFKCEAHRAAVDVYNALISNKYDDFWKKLAEKLEAYPITDKEEDREVARFIHGKLTALESESRMLASFTDDKYAANFWRWCKVLVDEEGYGKHAAAVKNKINPKGPTVKPRPLTRERVGDVKEKYWEWMKEFGEGMEYTAWWVGLANIWDEKYHMPYNADRRNREAPKLSETAFGSSSDEE